MMVCNLVWRQLVPELDGQISGVYDDLALTSRDFINVDNNGCLL